MTIVNTAHTCAKYVLHSCDRFPTSLSTLEDRSENGPWSIRRQSQTTAWFYYCNRDRGYKVETTIHVYYKTAPSRTTALFDALLQLLSFNESHLPSSLFGGSWIIRNRRGWGRGLGANWVPMFWYWKQCQKSIADLRFPSSKCILHGILDGIVACSNLIWLESRVRLETGHVEALVLGGLPMYIKHGLSMGHDKRKGDCVHHQVSIGETALLCLLKKP